MIAYCREGHALSEKYSVIGDCNLRLMVVKILKTHS